MLKEQAQTAFKEKDYDRACRKYEEALTLWRYYIVHNPKWSEEGIDDDELEAMEVFGSNQLERVVIKELKFVCYLNIAICSIKTKEYEAAIESCDEALKIEPNSVKAHFRRAKARIENINSGVDELNIAMDDLQRAI